MINVCEVLAQIRTSTAKCDNVVLCHIVAAWASSDKNVVLFHLQRSILLGQGLLVKQLFILAPQRTCFRANIFAYSSSFLIDLSTELNN